MADDFPKALLRGVRKSDWVKKSGVGAAAFMPDDRTVAERERDGLSAAAETSVNWEDDDGASAQMQGTEGAKYGIVRIDDVDAVFDFIRSRPALAGILTRERRREPKNHYHGNLLFDASSKEDWTRVAMILAADARVL